MKGIMRTRLVALLSMAGLVGSGSHATAQVLKGSDSDKTNSESTMNEHKRAQENNASKDQVIKKGHKVYHAQDALTLKQKVGESSAGDANRKWQKANAHLGDGSVKPGNETIGSAAGGAGSGNVKTSDLTLKAKKGAAETTAATGDHIKKGLNHTAETNASTGDHIKKGLNNAAETNAVQQNTQKKAVKATPK